MIGRASIEKATTRIFPSSIWRPRLGSSLVAPQRKSAPLATRHHCMRRSSQPIPEVSSAYSSIGFRPTRKAVCRNEEIHHHRVGVTRQGDEILSARAMRPSEPMLHGPLTCASPSHHRFYGSVRGAPVRPSAPPQSLVQTLHRLQIVAACDVIPYPFGNILPVLRR